VQRNDDLLSPAASIGQMQPEIDLLRAVIVKLDVSRPASVCARNSLINDITEWINRDRIELAGEPPTESLADQASGLSHHTKAAPAQRMPRSRRARWPGPRGAMT